MLDFQGHTMLVVGASSTIGKAFISSARARNATVLTTARECSAEKAPDFFVDVTDAASCDELAGSIKATGLRIDTVLNFTGMHHPIMALAEGTASSLGSNFAHVVQVNLTGAFHLTAALAPVLVRQHHGHIIHLCSDASRLSLEGSHAYVASKHGLEGLIKSSAAQLARYGVRVNGLAPGTVETDLNRSLLRSSDGTPSARAASILAHTPTKRFATLEGVIESALALCVPQRHLTGNVLFCDDGYVIEGHSWPDGNVALYQGRASLESLLAVTGRPNAPSGE